MLPGLELLDLLLLLLYEFGLVRLAGSLRLFQLFLLVLVHKPLGYPLQKVIYLCFFSDHEHLGSSGQTVKISWDIPQIVNSSEPLTFDGSLKVDINQTETYKYGIIVHS